MKKQFLVKHRIVHVHHNSSLSNITAGNFFLYPKQKINHKNNIGGYIRYYRKYNGSTLHYVKSFTGALTKGKVRGI